MNLWEFALKMELDGEKYYRELAEKTEYEDLKKVLADLAAAEKRHYKTIQSIQSQSAPLSEPAIPLTGIQNVFAAGGKFVADKKTSVAKLKAEQIDLYQAALAKEKESVALYQKLYEQVTTSQEKSICQQFIREEENHVAIFDDIIDMLNHVNDWVESAEFNLNEDNY